MKLNSEQVEAFLATAKIKNFTQASKILGITQSALSQRIAKLEDQLEMTLLIRDPGHLRLTREGEYLLQHAHQVDGLEADFFSKINQGSENTKNFTGQIRLASFSSIMRSKILPAIALLLPQKWPQLGVCLQTKEIRDLIPLLKSCQVDYLMTALPFDKRELSNHANYCFEQEIIGEEEYVWVTGPKGSNNGNKIFLDHDEFDQTTRQYCQAFNISMEKYKFHFIDDVYHLIDGVRLGLGDAILPKHLILEYIQQGKMSILRPKQILKIPVAIIYYRQEYYRSWHRDLIESLKESWKK